jgi:hypothetical protein
MLNLGPPPVEDALKPLRQQRRWERLIQSLKQLKRPLAISRYALKLCKWKLYVGLIEIEKIRDDSGTRDALRQRTGFE